MDANFSTEFVLDSTVSIHSGDAQDFTWDMQKGTKNASFCIYWPNGGVQVNFFRQIFVTCSYSYMLQRANKKAELEEI